MIPTAATTPVLLIIGFVMMQGLKSIDFGIEEWVPVGMLIISTLFYGISQGIGIGLLTYCGVKVRTTCLRMSGEWISFHLLSPLYLPC